MSASHSFRPKQALPVTPALLDEFLGTCTVDIAEQILKPLIPLSAGSHIHDNGCGSGAITSTLFHLQAPSSSPPANIRVTATDINPAYLSAIETAASAASWPVQTLACDSLSLTSIPSSTFTHSITNFVILQVWEKADALTAEIYRTLRPGGAAIVSTFVDLPPMQVYLATHRALGTPEDELPSVLRGAAFGGEEVQRAMCKAGFAAEKLKVLELKTKVRVWNPRRWAEIGWTLAGARIGGWAESDEATWQDAVGRAERELLEGPCWQDEDGGEGGWVEMKACVITAVK